MRAEDLGLGIILLLLLSKLSVANQLREEQCVALKQSSSHEVPQTFYICPRHNAVGHICEILRLPLELWYRNLTVYKSCCSDDEHTNLSWSNRTELSDCDSSWQDMFYKDDNYCNYSDNKLWSKTMEIKIIDPPALKALVWLIALFAVCGNLVVILNSSRLLKRTSKLMAKVQRVHHALLLNLSTADFLMGIYVLSTAVTAIVFNGPSGFGSFAFSQKSFCSALGILNVVSSQTSVTTLVLLTSFRLYSVFRPYRNVSVKLAAALAVFSWVIWLLIACIPFFNMDVSETLFNYIVVGACSNDRRPRVLDNGLLFQIAKRFFQMLNAKCKTVNPGYFMESDLFGFIRANKLFSVVQSAKLISKDVTILNYYMQQNHCSPRYFFNTSDDTRFFGLPILFYNFSAFLYLLIAYVFICIKTVKSGSGLEQYNLSNLSEDLVNIRQVENSRLQRKIFFIVTTDFFCWVPISVVSLWFCIDVYSSTFSEVCHQMVNWKQPLSMFTLIIVSINSAINPLLYSSALRSILGFVFRRRPPQTNEPIFDPPASPCVENSKSVKLPETTIA